MSDLILTHANLASDPLEFKMITDSKPLLRTTRREIFNVKFESWEPDHLHWVSPSNMIIYDNGDWFVFVSHLANMRRTGGWLDTGNYQSWTINVAYIDEKDSVIHSHDHFVCGLDYKQSRDNFGISGNDPSVPKILGSLTQGRFTRRVS
ncbi:hypothetical protein [Pectobacterium odoriferum]|uniref:hypothetical protein n=1 Tax=Pectobacterium odoriferum TaxID=78398 RepID=UPI0011AEE068|nr:hypothetical protein [Pectobacterium odoriferum]